MTRPSSSPRRWPDLLIGLLVVLLLAGFALLLLRPDGRPSAAPATGGTASPATQAPEAATPPATDIPAAPSPAESATVPEAPASAAAEAAPATAAPATEPPTIAASPVTPANQTPEAPADTAPAQDQANTDAAPAASSTPPEATPAEPTTSAPRSGGAVATSERRTPLRSDYRITLGTFTSESSARSAASGVSGLGYTVYPIDLGSQVVAQVGPFADEATARQALADIQRAYPRALLYPPRGRSLGGADTSSAPSASSDTGAASATSGPAAEAAAPAAAPSGPTYLQVGAFDRVESAQTLVGQLRDLGYAPTVNAPEGGKVTVLVGPYTGDALPRTEARLSANGLAHFRVR